MFGGRAWRRRALRRLRRIFRRSARHRPVAFASSHGIDLWLQCAPRLSAPARRPKYDHAQPPQQTRATNMTFVWPQMLWLLLLAPVLVGIYFWMLSRRRKHALRYASVG